MYTTKLLNIIDDVMPRRHQVIIATIVTFLSLASIAGSRPAERPAPAVQPAIIIVATPTLPPAGASGLVKEAAPMVWRAAPTVAPLPTAPPVVEPKPVIIMVVATPTEVLAAPLPSPVGPTGNPPRWTIR